MGLAINLCCTKIKLCQYLDHVMLMFAILSPAIGAGSYSLLSDMSKMFVVEFFFLFE
jgi:hypothetical protein